MRLRAIVGKATNKDNFTNLKGYVNFCRTYLDYIASNLQATIVSQNENYYNFYQYGREGDYQITRPINSNLMYDIKSFPKKGEEFLRLLKVAREIGSKDVEQRNILLHSVYTIQGTVNTIV